LKKGNKVIYIDKKEYRKKKIKYLPRKWPVIFLLIPVVILLIIFLNGGKGKRGQVQAFAGAFFRERQ